MAQIDYQAISMALLARAETIVAEWLPGGHVNGHEYVVRNPTRDDKTAGSFRINLRTGRWADFATSDRGRDLISLYAYINNTTQSNAARELILQCAV